MPPLWQIDESMFRAVHVGLRRDWLDPVFVWVTFSGLGYLQALPLIALLFKKRIAVAIGACLLLAIGISIVVEKSPLAALAAASLFAWLGWLERPIAVRALVALVAAGIFRLAIVQVLPRARPSNLDFAAPLEDLHGSTSFPSGHATTAFAVATVVCWAYAKGERSGLAVSALVWAVLVAFSRVYVGVHYPSDVIAAGLLGVATGSLCHWLWPGPRPGTEPDPVETV